MPRCEAYYEVAVSVGIFLVRMPGRDEKKTKKTLRYNNIIILTGLLVFVILIGRSQMCSKAGK